MISNEQNFISFRYSLALSSTLYLDILLERVDPAVDGRLALETRLVVRSPEFDSVVNI